MRKIRLYLFLILLASLFSCNEELVTIEVSNQTEDVVFITVRMADESDRFVSYRTSFEWHEIHPGEKKLAFASYDCTDESSWKLWVVKKENMKGHTLEDIIEKNLLEQVNVQVKTYSYHQLTTINFCVVIEDE